MEEIILPSNKKFGYFFTVVFTFTSLYLYINDHYKSSYLFLAIALTIFLTTLIKKELLLPFNKLWMRLGILLGMIISPLILGLIFYFLFTPISLLMKVFGRDELKLKVKSEKTHWKIRNNPLNTKSFKQQF